MPYYELPNQNRLSGLNTLAYMGVNPSTPNQFVLKKRDPTDNDYQGWAIGTMWLVEKAERLWMLMDKGQVGGVPRKATWKELRPLLPRVYHTDNGNALPFPPTQVLNVLGVANLYTEAVAPNADTINIGLVAHPILGALSINSMAAPGVLMSDAAGLITSTNGADGQVIVARAAGPVWADIVSSDGTILISMSGDPLHPNGINLRSLGGGGGGGITGLVADDANTATAPVAPPVVIEVFGSDVIRTKVDTVLHPHRLTIDIEDSLAGGDIIIGGGAGVNSNWGKITSTGGSVAVTYLAPLADPLIPYPRVNLEAAGVGALTQLTDDAGGGVVPDGAHNINIIGANGIRTTGAAHTLTVDSGAPNLNGRVLISTAGGAATWRQLAAGAGIAILESNDGAGKITITNTGGGGGGAGIQQINVDNGLCINPVTNLINFNGYAGTHTIDHSVAGNAYKNLWTYVNAAHPEAMYIMLSASLQLPLTNAAGSQGLLRIGVNDFMHAYGTDNTFLGSSAGNRAFTTATTISNTAIGHSALDSIDRNISYNTAVGSNAMSMLVGTAAANACSYNTAIGSGSFPVLGAGPSAGKYNTAIGYRAGTKLQLGNSNVYLGGVITDPAVPAAESHVLRIGAKRYGIAAGDGEQSSCYCAGITENNVIAAGAQVVTVSHLGQLQSLIPPLGGASGVLKSDAAGNISWGTGGAGILFNAYPMDTTNVTGNNTTYYLGSEVGHPLVLSQNVGGGIYSLGAAGVPAYYQIPYAGTYLLTMQIRFNGLKSFTPAFIPPPPPPPPPPIPVHYYDPMVIEVQRGGVTIKNWSYYPLLKYDGYTPYCSAFVSAVMQLQVGDRIRWFIQIDYRPGIQSNVAPYNIVYTPQATAMEQCIGIDTIDGDLQFSQVSVAILTD